MGCLFMISCSEEYITKDFVKGSYIPSTFYDNKDRANMALNAVYSTMNGGFASGAYILELCFADDLWGTGFIAGYGNYGSITDFTNFNTFGETRGVYNTCYSSVLMCNSALSVIPDAQKKANNPGFTQADVDSYLGQVYFMRAYSYYLLYAYWPQDKLVLRRTVPASQSEFIQAPAPKDSISAFIESDLKKAQTLLSASLNTTATYEKGRFTRGSATGLLGKLYMLDGKYAQAAAEFKKLLPGVGDAAYGTYSLMPDYRDNFTSAKENNAESILEVQFYNVTNNGQELSGVLQNWTLNRTTNKDMWWNWAVPTFRLNEFENWTETIAGVPTTVYDYRAYETFWGVPNGASYTYSGTTLDWKQQKWDVESVIAGLTGVYSIRKYAFDNNNQQPAGGNFTNSDINFRLIRLSDIMLLYAECLANLNPANVTATDVNSAIYWVDQVRTRANKPMADQTILYSARASVPGQLPTATDLMAAKGWTVQQLIEHERYVELYCEGWRGQDMKRWKKGASYVQYKAGWKGYESLTIPIPQDELDANPLMPR